MTTLVSPRSALREYRVLGIRVQSDRELASLREVPAPATAIPDLRLTGTGVLTPHTDSQPIFIHKEGPTGVELISRFTGNAQIAADGRTVEYALCPGARETDIQHFLTGPVISIALQLQGHVLLHGGAFVVGKECVAFVGNHAAGKSTLAASLVGAGFDVLTDDVLPLRPSPMGETWFARRSVPWVKLDEDSLAAMGKTPDGLAPVSSATTKRRVPLDPLRASETEYQLAALFILDPQDASDAPLRASPILGVEAAGNVLRHMYASDALFRQRAVTAFEAAARIAEAIPVRTLSYYRSYENLPAIRQAMVDEVAGLPSHD